MTTFFTTEPYPPRPGARLFFAGIAHGGEELRAGLILRADPAAYEPALHELISRSLERARRHAAAKLPCPMTAR